MKMNCNVIHDLLPLYADKICSDESRKLVDGHLADCKDCSALLQQMLCTKIETELKSERSDVILRQAKFFKRRSAVAGAVIAGIFMIPILVCLIVNLAAGSALDWFFIVLASLITAVSLIIVPLMVPENKLFWTFVTFTASLLLLFGVICIYTQGNWFFVASLSVLFGFSVCFLPFSVYAKPLKKLLGRQKGLTVMTAITLLFLLMMLSIGIYTGSADFWKTSAAISLPFLALAWLLFLFIRYSKIHGLTKGGICTILIGVFGFFADTVISACLGLKQPLPAFYPFIWQPGTLDGNVKWLFLLSCTFVGIILIIVGIIKRRK